MSLSSVGLWPPLPTPSHGLLRNDSAPSPARAPGSSEDRRERGSPSPRLTLLPPGSRASAAHGEQVRQVQRPSKAPSCCGVPSSPQARPQGMRPHWASRLRGPPGAAQPACDLGQDGPPPRTSAHLPVHQREGVRAGGRPTSELWSLNQRQGATGRHLHLLTLQWDPEPQVSAAGQVLALALWPRQRRTARAVLTVLEDSR